MLSRQRALTVIAPIAADREGDLRALLARIDAEVRRSELGAAAGATVPFGDLASVHFARLVILAPARKRGTARLLFATDFDGTVDRHLNELVAKAGSGLALVFRHCEGYPRSATAEAGLRAYLESWRRDEHASYVGARGRTVAEIRRQHWIASAIREFLDREGDRLRQAGQQSVQVLAAVQKHLFRSRLLEAGEAPPEPPRRAWSLAHDLRAAAILFGLLVVPFVLGGVLARRLGLSWWLTIPLALVAVIAWLLPPFVLLLVRELRDAVPDREHREALRSADPFGPPERADVDLVNEMTNVCEIKAGWFRMALCGGVLRIADAFARLLSYKGTLGGIPSIHFARWVIVPEDRRLVFLSNYDGSWESYLGDFVDRSAVGLTAIWSHARGFPPTRALAFRGARDEEPFKWIVRICQVETQVWYRAYPELSLQRILKNVEIHRGALAAPDPERSDAWLSLL